jgi:hypothetical protein
MALTPAPDHALEEITKGDDPRTNGMFGVGTIASASWQSTIALRPSRPTR